MSESKAPSSHPQVPTFLQKKATDPAATLFYIQDQVSIIYKSARANQQDEHPPPPDHNTYIKIYTAIWQFTTAGGRRSNAAHLAGEEIYRVLEREIRNYCIDIREVVFTASDDADGNPPRKLLSGYVASYRRFANLSILMKNLMKYVERHWIRREIDEKKKNIYLIEDLHKLIWREEILQISAHNTLSKKGVEDLSDAVAALQGANQGITEHDRKLITDVVKALASLSITFDS
ncbi:Cullin repeat-containing protein [Aureobasidium subglaciale]|nr:Cullin repeat-containing protein [Aureobasidium subglaciale]KAI5271482.1 Cullin repeat-containing protein [Aureobasidium subglaciale]